MLSLLFISTPPSSHFLHPKRERGERERVRERERGEREGERERERDGRMQPQKMAYAKKGVISLGRIG